MIGRRGALALVAALLVPAAGAGQPATDAVRTPSSSEVVGGSELTDWLASIRDGLSAARTAAAAGDAAAARTAALRVYLDHFERIEAYYGPGGPHAASGLTPLVSAAERRFHELLGAGSAAEAERIAAGLADAMLGIGDAARSAGVALAPEAPDLAASDPAPEGTARTPEVAALLTSLGAARAAHEAGDGADALARVETMYLDGVEPLEPRLPGDVAARLERAIHIGLRPALAQGADAERVTAAFNAVQARLLDADAALGSGGSFWFGVFNSFTIILREGLEAVLLVGALLAYLGATGAGAGHRRQIYAGVGLGVVASFATWGVARAIIPIGGAGRELVEGITGLVAVAVLLYVSNWLFQKTYIHDWKAFLQQKVDAAATTGSALAMASLAFAAVYREGFETVLFYQALTFDAGASAVLTGFVPGLVLIVAVGIGIIRLGLRLPLKRVFGATNAILLYLAFAFIGKSLYNLQEAGLYAPHPVAWVPDTGALRQLLGIYPVQETLLAQAAFMLLVGTTYLVYRRVGARSTAVGRPQTRAEPRRHESAPAREARERRTSAETTVSA